MSDTSNTVGPPTTSKTIDPSTSSGLQPVIVPYLSPTGLKILAGREGQRLVAYRDTRGIWTIGIGHTAAAGPPIPQEGMTLTEASMIALFAADVKPYERAVWQATSPIVLANHQFDALVSMCYNIGIPGFRGSSAALMIRENRFAEVPAHMLLWDDPPEIIGRRKQEAAQFATAYGSM